MKEKNKGIGAALVFTCGWIGIHSLYYREYKNFFLHLIGPAIVVIAYVLASTLYGYAMLSVRSVTSVGEPNYDNIVFLIRLFWFGVFYSVISYFVAIINFVRKKL